MKQRTRQRNAFGRFQFRMRFLFDILATLISWFGTYYIRFYLMPSGTGDSPLFFALLGLYAVVTTFIVMFVLKLYESKNTSDYRTELKNLMYTAIWEFMIFVVTYYYCFDYKISRVHLVLYAMILFLMLALGRNICNDIFTSQIEKGKYKQKVLLVGYGAKLEEYYKAITSSSTISRMQVMGQYLGGDNSIPGLKIIETKDLQSASDKVDADVVVVSFPRENYETEQKMVIQAMELFDQVVYTLPVIPKTYVGTVIRDYKGVPVLELNSHHMSTGKKFIKRFCDIFICLCAVVVLSPLYLLLAILVKLSSKGPVFFKQNRVTENGKVFGMLKFRSMRTDMPETGGAHWTEENDPRITKIGRILRKTSLDELPQFFNVIGGSMSLIGPRPERPELEEKFKDTIPGYKMRHRMKAGITGWAQVNGLRGNTSLEKRVEYDLYYISRWTLSFDIKIFFMTFVSGFINKNAY